MSVSKSNGFALPTVMIASIVMLIVLLSGLVSATSINSALRDQFEAKLVRQAAEAGKQMAIECAISNGGAANWTVLYPNSACNTTSTSNLCPDSGAPAGCFLVNSPSYKTTFTVGPMTTDANGFKSVTVQGFLRKTRSRDGGTQSTISSQTSAFVDLQQWKDVVLVANGTSACGLTDAGVIYCWGENAYGQLGDGTTTSRSDAVRIENTDGTPSSLRFNTIYGSWNTVCGITTTQDAYCWGGGREGVMGNGDANNRLYPTRISNGQNSSGKWTKLAMLNYTSCGIGYGSTAGRIFCWGGNQNYNFGTGNTTNSYTPVMSTGSNYTDVAGGSHHVCGIASGGIWCWGLTVNSNASWYCRIPPDTAPNYDTAVVDCPGLGNRGYSTTTTYTNMAASSTERLISGSDEVCKHEDSGHLACFGANFKGQAGDYGYGPDDGYATVGNRATIQNCVRNLAGNCVVFKSAQHGAFGVCGIDINNDAWCWGMGIYGMHGDGPAGFLQPSNYNGGHINDGSHTVMGTNPVISTTYAVRVTGGLKFRKLFGSGGGYGYCGLTFDNKLYCWGRSLNGIFGIKDGTPRYYTSPTLAPDAIKSPPLSLSF